MDIYVKFPAILTPPTVIQLQFVWCRYPTVSREGLQMYVSTNSGEILSRLLKILYRIDTNCSQTEEKTSDAFHYYLQKKKKEEKIMNVYFEENKMKKNCLFFV